MKQELGKLAKDFNEIIESMREAVQKKVEDAYHKGWEYGKEYGLDEADMREAVSYQKGLDDAWEAVKTLFKTFGTESACVIMKNDNVHGAIDRLKAYEEKQKTDEDVKRGDVVRSKVNGLTYIVTLASESGYVLLRSDGNFATSCITNSFEKTGKHVNIDKILDEMKRED